MRRRKFLAWIASLPFVTTLFPKLVADIRRPKIDELRDFCRESLERQLTERFPDRRCEVVLKETILLFNRLGFTSVLFNMNDPKVTDDNIEDHLSECMSGITESVQRMLMDASSKSPDIDVRINSLERIDRGRMANDRNGRALGLDDEVVVADSGTWLVLKWDIAPEGFFQWIRPEQAFVIAKDGSGFEGNH